MTQTAKRHYAEIRADQVRVGDEILTRAGALVVEEAEPARRRHEVCIVSRGSGLIFHDDELVPTFRPARHARTEES